MSEREVRPALSEEEFWALVKNYPDLLKSAGIGAVRGATSVAGFPGYAGNVLNENIDRAIAGAGDLIGRNWQPAPLGPALDESAIQRGIERHTGPFYQPKTQAGEYVSEGAKMAVEGAAMSPILKGMKAAREISREELRREFGNVPWRELLGRVTLRGNK